MAKNVEYKNDGQSTLLSISNQPTPTIGVPGLGLGINLDSNKLSLKIKKENKKTNKIEINIIKKLNNIITIKNFEGLIGVVPILFNRDEFLNSKILCGINTNPIVSILIATPPGKKNSLPKVEPKKSNIIKGNINANKGPMAPFQKYLFTNLKTVNILKEL
jgi:hypothetical protein